MRLPDASYMCEMCLAVYPAKREATRCKHPAPGPHVERVDAFDDDLGEDPLAAYLRGWVAIVVFVLAMLVLTIVVTAP